ncbi:MAG: NADH-quinone oxidoreductase subunit J [Acetobacteraceae bacterium]|nr:NADH-quinone oxidoreductase subunit J [Acetobacteraceae bacterium]
MVQTRGGVLLVLALVLPVAAMLVALPLGGRAARRIALAVLPVGLLLAIAITVMVQQTGEPLVYLVGGWAPPLGIALRADGISAAMLLTAALVLGAVGLYARISYPEPRDGTEARAPFAFWLLLLALWGALVGAFVGGDLFNLFVALEMLAFAALALACLDGRPTQFKAELRYLLYALLGSVLYLLGSALFYGNYGTLDVVLLSRLTRADLPTIAAAALMTGGLLAKTALLPLHLWLPPAHSGAPPAASALLSAVVVKAAFFLLLRLWFGALAGVAFVKGAQALALLGAGAILIGSVLALAQQRLKLLVAYSTVAQIGYLFLMFPLVSASPLAGAWTGGILQAISHALAKAAMFLAAGLLADAAGNDRIDGLAGMARGAPRTVLAFALGGMTLMGLPPSGGFSAKWLLLQAAIATGQWWWALVVLLGGLLTGSYVYRVLRSALREAPGPQAGAALLPAGQQNAALSLAVLSMLIGLLPLGSFGLLQVGRLDIALAGLR